MLTLEKFEEASEKVKEVVLPTNLIYSEYFSEQTGNKVYFKPENMQYTGAYNHFYLWTINVKYKDGFKCQCPLGLIPHFYS